jgi:cation diffusion facilitator family transporter
MHQRAEDEAWDPFPPAGRRDEALDRRDAHRAIGVSAVGLALTGLVEMAIAVLGGSVGLLGDALHNLADVSTSAVVFIGFRVSQRPATPSRPYGYERAEDLAGLGVALVIWASGALAAVLSVHKLTEHGHTLHLGLGMAAAVVGVVGNQVVSRYKGRVGRRIHSATLIADAQHSWLDSLSSAGAFIGLVGVAAGWAWADGVAGLIVTGFIIHVGWEVTRDVFEHLMDGVDPTILKSAEEVVLSRTGVQHVHVRARWLGRSLLIELELFAPADLTVGDAAALAADAEQAVVDAVPQSRAVAASVRALPATAA